jgi:uncharacterized repeat protein (TIGR03806 family)
MANVFSCAPAAAARLLAMALCLSGCGGGSDDAGVAPPAVTPPASPPASAGLDARPVNTACVAPARATGSTTLATQRVFSALSFVAPVGMQQAPGDANRWFVIEQGGRVRSFANTAAVSSAASFIDISARVVSGGETGLLGMAFHPQFPTNPRVYLSYTTGSPLTSRIAEFRSTDGGATLDPATERTLITVNQPESNHNGGHIAFGPDGLLYIAFGDGGGGGDQHGSIGNGQLLTTLLGKMLRIDVNASPGGAAYGIPAGNPFAGGARCNAGGSAAQNCAEIYAYGLRNPWRFSFDRQTAALWAADVGQGAWEEVDRISAGGNYGWRCREGAHAFNASCGGAPSLFEPVAEYDHAAGQSITGGFVYRGTANPALAGRYVFGDFVSGRIWNIPTDTAPTLRVTSGFDSGLSIASFAEGNDGELYVVHYAGQLYRLTAATTGGSDPVATQLSQTGCLASSGLIPYAPRVPFWSDGADKERWLALPAGQSIGVGSDGDFDFPNGSVLVKNFRLGNRLVETRLFMRHPDGVWAGYSYEWNAGGTDATRVSGGKTVTVAGQSWVFPSEAQCLHCHTEGAGRTLGLETAQLNSSLVYPATGRTANQIATLNAIGVLSPAIVADPATLPALPDPAGSTASVAERARAYLHSNCANCHRPGGGTPVNLDLRYGTTLALTNACAAAPQAGDLGIGGALLITPGNASLSLLVARMNRRATGQMPPLSSTVVDTAGVTLVSSWIASLTGCN